MFLILCIIVSNLLFSVTASSRAPVPLQHTLNNAVHTLHIPDELHNPQDLSQRGQHQRREQSAQPKHSFCFMLYKLLCSTFHCSNRKSSAEQEELQDNYKIQSSLLHKAKHSAGKCCPPLPPSRAHLVSLRVLSRAADSSKPSARLPKASPRICLLWMGMY